MVKRVLIVAVIMIVMAVIGVVATPTITNLVSQRGVTINTGDAADGYILFAPQRSLTTYLVDNNGSIINTWESEYHPGRSVYLLDNGNLIRAGRIPAIGPVDGGGLGGRFEEFTWDGELVWSFEYYSETYHPHHDFIMMPNGNILFLVYEFITPEEAISQGLNPELLPEDNPGIISDKIIEVDRTTNEIVWEWRLWDHLIQDFDASLPNYGVIADNPQRMNVNYYRFPLVLHHSGS
ncbi:MAG: aryl-sulfate sulfotransferase [Bacteroidota bacterium]